MVITICRAVLMCGPFPLIKQKYKTPPSISLSEDLNQKGILPYYHCFLSLGSCLHETKKFDLLFPGDTNQGNGTLREYLQSNS